MNVDALKKGYKLTEDYIHPEDRDNVIDTIYQAVANGVTDYMHTYRMVRDDGKQIWVENEVSVPLPVQTTVQTALLTGVSRINHKTVRYHSAGRMASSRENLRHPIQHCNNLHFGSKSPPSAGTVPAFF